MSDVTRILSQIESGDAADADQLLPLVYDELRKLAASKLSREKPGQTLNATALVHEAYARLGSGENDQKWDSRGHYFTAAAEAMRRILVESARRKGRWRHGKGHQRVDFDSGIDVAGEDNGDLLALDEALQRLAAEEPVSAEVVKLRYFAGLTIEQAAIALDISVRTASRHWAYARAWLYEQLS